MTHDELAARLSKLKFTSRSGAGIKAQSSNRPYPRNVSLEISDTGAIPQDNDLFNRFQSLSDQSIERAAAASALEEDSSALDDESQVQNILSMAQDAVHLEEKYSDTSSKSDATTDKSEDNDYDSSEGNSTDSLEASGRKAKKEPKRTTSGTKTLNLPSVPSEDPDVLGRRTRAKDALKTLAEEGCSMCGKNVDLLCLDCRRDQDNSFLYCQSCFEITHHGDGSLFKHTNHRALPFSKFA